LFDYCLQNGVIIYRFLSSPSSFRMAPPLTISLEELEFGMKVILEGLNSLKCADLPQDYQIYSLLL